jgi:hypothetical protein
VLSAGMAAGAWSSASPTPIKLFAIRVLGDNLKLVLVKYVFVGHGAPAAALRPGSNTQQPRCRKHDPAYRLSTLQVYRVSRGVQGRCWQQVHRARAGTRGTPRCLEYAGGI